jgi:hypothetical protein
VASFAPDTSHSHKSNTNKHVASRPNARIVPFHNSAFFQHGYFLRNKHRTITVATTSSSSLFLLLDVPDDFFTITFPMLGILLSISKNFARIRMEERAWEQRLEEGRSEYLRRHPSMTELDLRRKEAAQEWSAYGVPRRQQEERREEAAQKEEAQEWKRDSRRSRVFVLDREEEAETFVASDDAKSRRIRKEDYCMTEEEIELFEQEFGVVYDPYYDDPYTVDELPDGKCEIDKLYGDRIYPNGEIFYKDGSTGLFYRQGSKPRNLSFFGVV